MPPKSSLSSRETSAESDSSSLRDWVDVADDSSVISIDDQSESQALTERTPTSAEVDGFCYFLLLNPYVVDGDLWLDYYSRDVMMSIEAETHFVLPDRKQLPNLITRDVVKGRKDAGPY